MATRPFLSLCTGAAGLDIGVWRGSGGSALPICYVENELTAAAVIRANIQAGELPDAPIWSDIRTLDFEQFRGIEGMVGGYPCTPFSTAGSRMGAASSEKHLWPYIEEGIKAAKPVWCFFENVTGHLSLGFDTVAESLRSMGYEVAAALVTAEEVGAPHRRERLFILALANPYVERGCGGDDRWQHAADALTSNSEIRSKFPPSPDATNWRSFISKWPELHPSIIPDFLRISNGDGDWLDISSRDRIRLCGNGVVSDAAAFAWRELWNEIG